ncbi:hypothetical protein [Acrocarpospora catenulata]|uniref:hypothetical protein n=1 Tax=Acrocarpospora catenulata TaxID=2836182 RepID=UPI001BD93EF8|nr:hypothetical protein [Acrocarpospora catenulata]
MGTLPIAAIKEAPKRAIIAANTTTPQVAKNADELLRRSIAHDPAKNKPSHKGTYTNKSTHPARLGETSTASSPG